MNVPANQFKESFWTRVVHTLRQSRFLIVGLIAVMVGLLGWLVFNRTRPTTDFPSATDTSRSITGARTDGIPTNPKLVVGTTGNYYALLIGIDTYEDSQLKDLNRPVADMESLQAVLTELYDFNASHIVALKNPTRALILGEFDKLTTSIAPADNLLIFYAGHGVYNAQLKQGYWLPADARKVNRADWLANSTVREYINGINARHVLLISDACYSGSFLVLDRGESATPSVEQAYQRSSRRAITSSIMEVVPDESIFAEELVVTLRHNADHFLTTSDLYQRFAPVVTNKNATQLPQFGRIKGDVD